MLNDLLDYTMVRSKSNSWAERQQLSCVLHAVLVLIYVVKQTESNVMDLVVISD